ncbi:polysaccharide deacetylase family protein [Aliiglaciecola litoralis]|uniref:Polysaccharide deacetylase family protein n=1 Tax=Aliiglaciecola litoralis TaxID=582857 RepID=A0ABN1LF16_9ALTE
MHIIQKLIGAACFFCCFTAATFATTGHGVILMYHHVSDQTPPSTSISAENFAKHMQYLAENHNVVSLPKLIESLKTSSPLPGKAVAITFDDGYQNIAQNAHPILRKHGFPYTIFINPDVIGNESQQLSWEEVAELQKEGVTFANHTSKHKHLLLGSEQDDWLDATLKDIEHAEAVLHEKTGHSHKLLAYPYGEYNQALSEAIQERGYIGFGQHSGAVSSNSNFGALPRFPAAGIYANLDTLKVKLNSLDMPVIATKIQQPQLTFADRQPTQTVTIETSDILSNQLACYFEGQQISTQWQQSSFTFSFEKPLSVGRSRVNCTAPSQRHQGRFYWFSQPWFVPTEDHQWPD